MEILNFSKIVYKGEIYGHWPFYIILNNIEKSKLFGRYQK